MQKKDVASERSGACSYDPALLPYIENATGSSARASKKRSTQVPCHHLPHVILLNQPRSCRHVHLLGFKNS